MTLRIGELGGLGWSLRQRLNLDVDADGHEDDRRSLIEIEADGASVDVQSELTAPW